MTEARSVLLSSWTAKAHLSKELNKVAKHEDNLSPSSKIRPEKQRDKKGFS